MARRTKEDADATRNALLDAAELVFYEKGVARASLSEIAQAAGANPKLQAVLLIWIFAIRAIMLVASAMSYFVNEAIAKRSYGDTDFDFEKPLTSLVWITSIVSIVLTFACSSFLLAGNGVSANLWWQLSIIISCGTLAGALIPELVKVFTSTQSRHVREVVMAAIYQVLRRAARNAHVLQERDEFAIWPPIAGG